MSDKETLKLMKRVNDSLSGNLNKKEIGWIIEQAEKVEELQKEIEQLKAEKQVLSNYKFMYEQAKY